MMSLILTPNVCRNQCQRPSIGVLWTLRMCSVGGNWVVSRSGVYAALSRRYNQTTHLPAGHRTYLPQTRLTSVDNSCLTPFVGDKSNGDYWNNLSMMAFLSRRPENWSLTLMFFDTIKVNMSNCGGQAIVWDNDQVENKRRPLIFDSVYIQANATHV